MNALSRGIAAAAIATGLAATAAHAETTEINFGIISTESQQNLKTVWLPFLQAMEQETGLKVNPFFASDYAGIIEGMRFGKVHVAWYGNKSAIEAVDRADGEVFVQSVDVSGNPGYWSLLVTNADSPLQSLDDALKCDKSLAFGNGDPNSTSGFLVPSVFVFTANKVEPKDCYKAVTNASHEANLMAVANKQVDFATNNTESLARLQETNPEAFGRIKVIWKSPLIPADPIVWRKDLDEEAKRKLYTFFLSYGRLGAPDQVEKAREVLGGLKWAPFKPSSDAQLYPIRVLEISKNIARIQADEKLSADEKKAEIGKLEAQKKEIEDLMAKVPQV